MLPLESPAYLWLLGCLPGLFLIHWLSYRKRKRLLLAFSTSDLLIRTNPSVKLKFSPGYTVLLSTALSLFLVTIANPNGPSPSGTGVGATAEVIFVLDVSPSMQARDILPDRLTAARKAVMEISKNLQGARFGLVLFSGISIFRCPLTGDHAAFDWFLNSFSADEIPIPGTDIRAALQMAFKGFTGGSNAKGRIVLVTDGENHGQKIQKAVDEAVGRHLVISVIGVGEPPGMPIPLSSNGGGFKKAPDGELVLTRLDEPLLKRIADKTGGTYLRLSLHPSVPRHFYETPLPDKTPASNTGTSRKKPGRSRHYWFLVPAILVFILALATDDTL